MRGETKKESLSNQKSANIIDSGVIDQHTQHNASSVCFFETETAKHDDTIPTSVAHCIACCIESEVSRYKLQKALRYYWTGRNSYSYVPSEVNWQPYCFFIVGF